MHAGESISVLIYEMHARLNKTRQSLTHRLEGRRMPEALANYDTQHFIRKEPELPRKMKWFPTVEKASNLHAGGFGMHHINAIELYTVHTLLVFHSY